MCRMLIDIHTHILEHNPANLCFLIGKHALGIHPWELSAECSKESIEKKFQELERQDQKEVLAVGECGLDRARSGLVGMDIQLEVLNWHMTWATKTERPLILHCVRSHSDLLMLLKKNRYLGKILLHDYSGNLDEAMKFLNYDTWFSFGASFFRKNSKTPQVFKALPKERLFLETDDQREHSLEAIYDKASELLRMNRVDVEELMLSNLKSFFSDLNDVSASDLIAYLR